MLGGSLRAFSRCERPTTPRMGAAVVLGCSTICCGGAAGAGGWDWGWGVAAILIAFTVLQITEVLALSELSADISILFTNWSTFFRNSWNSYEILFSFKIFALFGHSLVCWGFFFLFIFESLFLKYYVFILIQTQLETIPALYPFHGKHYFKNTRNVTARHGTERNGKYRTDSDSDSERRHDDLLVARRSYCLV